MKTTSLLRAWAAAVLAVAGTGGAHAKDLVLQGMIHDKLMMVDGQTDEIVGTVKMTGQKITAITWDPKNLDRVFCVTDWGQMIERVDLAERKVVGTFRFASGDVKVRTLDIEVSPSDSNILYALSLRQRWLPSEIQDLQPVIYRYDLAAGRVTDTFEVPRGMTNIFLSKDGTELYAIGRDVHVLDARTGKLVNFLGVAHPTTTGVDPQIALNVWKQQEQSDLVIVTVGSQAKANQHLYLGYYTIDLRKKSTERSMRLVTDIAPLYNVFSATISPDRKYAYFVMNGLQKIDLEKNRIIASAPVDKTYYSVNVSSDGTKVDLGGGGDTIRVHETSELKHIKNLDTPGDAVLTFLRVQKR